MTGILSYASAAIPTTLSTSLSSVSPGSTGTVVVASNTGWPTVFPFTIIVDWDTVNAEVITVTQAATGSGPFTYANCVRGDDGSNSPAHGAGATVTHGVSARDFYKGGSDWFNVVSADYGADPTGTNDSAAGINAAITACVAAGGGTVYFPAGTYKLISGPVLVDGSFVTLRGTVRGAGGSVLTGAFSSIQQGMLIMGATAVRTACSIFDLDITGNAANNSGHCVVWRIETGAVYNLTCQKPGTATNTFTFTATNASPCVFTATGSNYAANQQVILSNTTPGTNSMPTGFVAGLPYFVSATGLTANTFQLAQVYGGSSVNSTSTGGGSVQQLSDCFHASAGDIGGHIDDSKIMFCSFQNLNGGAGGFYNDGNMSDSTVAHCEMDGATAVSGNWGCCYGILDQGGSNRFIDCHPFGYAYAGAVFNGRNTDVDSGEYESTGNLGPQLANIVLGLSNYGTSTNNKMTVRGVKTYYNTNNFSGTRSSDDFLISGASNVTIADCSMAWGGGNTCQEISIVGGTDVKIHHNDAIANQFDSTVTDHFVLCTTNTGNTRLTIDHNHMTTTSGAAAININDATHSTIDGNIVTTNSVFKETSPAEYNTWARNDVTAVSGTPIQLTGTHSVAYHNPGYNPVGHIASPALAGSGNAYVNAFGVDAMVCVSGGTVSAIAVNSTATGLTSGPIRVPAGGSITLTYTSNPTWNWFGD